MIELIKILDIFSISIRFEFFSKVKDLAKPIDTLSDERTIFIVGIKNHSWLRFLFNNSKDAKY